jgi:polysaccharide export outer membrane protein
MLRCLIVMVLVLAGCTPGRDYPAPPATLAEFGQETRLYRIAPLDSLDIFVWRAPELSASALVRPDGRISVPLVEEVEAAGRTPMELARELEEKLAEFVQAPSVTVSVANFGFGGAADQTVRVVGEAQTPSSVPYQSGLSVLDLMVAVGGLTEFAAGNRALLIRRAAADDDGDGDGREEEVYRLRLDDLLDGGDTSVDVPLLPGDIILVPQSLI